MNRCKQQKRRNQGFTLIELLIGIAIVAIIALIVNRYIFSSSKLYCSGNNEVNLQIELQILVDHISDEMLECESIITIESGKRYILRKSQEEGLLIVYDASIHTVSQRSIVVKAEELSGAGTLEEKFTAKMKEKSSETYDVGNLVTLSDMVTKCSIDNAAGLSNVYSIVITMDSDGKSKRCSKQVKLRNS